MISDSEMTSSTCVLRSYNGSLSAMLEVISQKPERCRIIVASHNEESVRRAAKWSVVNITSTSNKDIKLNIQHLFAVIISTNKRKFTQFEISIIFY